MADGTKRFNNAELAVAMWMGYAVAVWLRPNGWAVLVMIPVLVAMVHWFDRLDRDAKRPPSRKP